MSKKLMTLAVAAIFLASTATVSIAAKEECTVDSSDGSTVVLTCPGTDLTAGKKIKADKAKCEVTAVDGDKVTADCGKKASKLSAGSTVKVKESKKKAIEGC